MGSPLSGLDLPIWSRMKESLQLGSWEQFFRPVLGMSLCHPLVGRFCSVAEWVPHSVVFASGMDFVCVPLANEGVGLGPSPFGPVASRPPLGIGLLRRPRGDSFHLGIFSCVGLPRMGGLASGSSGSQASRLGCWFTFMVPQILCLVPLRGCGRISGFWYSGTGVAPGIIPSSWHGFLHGARSVFVRWGSVGLLRISDVHVFLSECTLRPGLGFD